MDHRETGSQAVSVYRETLKRVLEERVRERDARARLISILRGHEEPVEIEQLVEETGLGFLDLVEVIKGLQEAQVVEILQAPRAVSVRLIPPPPPPPTDDDAESYQKVPA